MQHRRVPGIALGLLALVVLLASTSVTVDVVSSASSEEARQAAITHGRETRSSISRGTAIGGVLLLIPAIWLVVAAARADTSSGR
jgi:hypothetical protein